MTNGAITSEYMGFCRLDKNHPIRRIDIQLFAVNSFPAAVLYFTGSANFNKKMRAIAHKKNYLLNQVGLFKLDKKKSKNTSDSDNKTFDSSSDASEESNDSDTSDDDFTNVKKTFVKVQTEKDIFKELGMKYLPPEDRI